MSVTETSPPDPNTTTKLALTAPAPTAPNSSSTSESESAVVRAWSGLEADGGIDDETMGADPEAALSTITEINDHLIQIGYANHLVVLLSVAVLNEAGVRPVKVKPIRDVANRMATETTFERSNIDTSLNALYGEDDELGFVNRKWASRGNAYHWYVTDRGRAVLAYLYELGIITALAESALTADID